MIDINELRFTAAKSTRDLALLPSEVNELLDRLEAAEKERDALRTELKEIRYGVAVAHDTIKALRAKIEQMERQEPVGEIQRANSTGNYINSVVWVPMAVGSKLYALPGAQGEEK